MRYWPQRPTLDQGGRGWTLQGSEYQEAGITGGHRGGWLPQWLSSLSGIYIPLGKFKPKSFNFECQCWDFPGGAVVKNPPANVGDMGSSPGPGRSHMPRSN